jgi:FecR-like protein
MRTEDDPQSDHQIDGYLWDPSAPPAPAVQDVERRLAPARFEAVRRPLNLPATVPRRPRHLDLRLLALAAGIALVAGMWAFSAWRWSWPSGAPWPVTIQAGAPGLGETSSRLQLDRRLELGTDTSARVEIARIGTMSVAPGSALILSETRSSRHRVQLDRGSVRVRVWAPPGRFAVETPAGSVIDLGCIFELSVDARGTARLRVDTGWVQLANGWGEALVPAGASSSMSAASRPGVPIYDDAAPAFAAGVRALERAADDATRVQSIGAVVTNARARDVLTLLVLTTVAPESARRPLLDRAARLVPPPANVSVDAILAGDSGQLWRWHQSLDLPPPKSWWLNWRDALPRPR